MLKDAKCLQRLAKQLFLQFRFCSRAVKLGLFVLVGLCSFETFGVVQADAYVRVSYRGRYYNAYPYRYRGSYHYRGGIYRSRYYRYGGWHYY